jgi:polysaccharide biosynthesis protein PslG
MSTKSLRTTVLSGLAISLIGLASGSHANDLILGACVHLSLGRGNPDDVIAKLRGAHFTALRDDVYWTGIEKEQGVLKFPDSFQGLEKAVKEVHDSGGRPLLILDFGNPFYDNGGMITSAAGLEAFQRYARFVVKHFGDSVDQYEVWNEWNSGFGSKPKQSHGDPVAYMHLLKATYEAVKAENPKALVVGGVTAGIDLPWTKAFIEAGGLQYLDVFSVHSYTLFKEHPNPENAIGGIDAVRTLISASAKRNIPIYVSEMGWPTNTGTHGVKEDMAAAYIIRFLALVKARPWVGGVWIYDLIDDGSSDTAMEQRFGLLRTNSTPKPGYAAVTRMAILLNGSSNVQAYRLAVGGYAVTGTTNGQQWLVAWKIEPEARTWASGQPPAIEGNHSFDWTEAQLPEDGLPVFWNKSGLNWARDPLSPKAPAIEQNVH